MVEKKQNISQYRGRLDRTLASDELTNEESIKLLVKNQVLNSIECQNEVYAETVIERKAKELSSFIQMLKSASEYDDDSVQKKKPVHGDWKIKQDTEECRVMYREGPEGTPLHTLLVEGYVDGTTDICLCISWETNLYPKWWPQFTVPTFKIVLTECLQKVGVDEQISLMRMKVPWPLSTREAVVHFFAFEYYKDDLIIVILNSISEDSVDISTHGFSRETIPKAQDVTRIDVVGGFAIQKVNEERSYFRTIANMDIKLDFVPPAFINFTSRQVIGSGFKLYQKKVASISKGGDEDFTKALTHPLYTRVREALYSKTKEPENSPMEDQVTESAEPVLENGSQSLSEDITIFPEQKFTTEIQEIEEEVIDSSNLIESHDEFKEHMKQRISVSGVNKIRISAEVKQALETLEQAIYVVRENGQNSKVKPLSGFNNEECFDLIQAQVKEEDSRPLQDPQVSSIDKASIEEPKIETMVEKISLEPRSNSLSRVVPAFPEDLPTNGQMSEQSLSRNNENEKMGNGNQNEMEKNIPTKMKKNKKKKTRLCCFHFISNEGGY